MPSNLSAAVGEVRGRGKDTAELDHVRVRVFIQGRHIIRRERNCGLHGDVQGKGLL